MLTKLIHGSAHDIDLPDASVQAIITSPPYYSLRSYSGDQAVEWPTVCYSPLPGQPEVTILGCNPECNHKWGDTVIKRLRSGDSSSTMMGPQSGGRLKTASKGSYCQKCGGWRGGLGEEPSIEAYIGHLILCLREWHRVLRNDGVCLINLGDSYAGSGGAGGDYSVSGRKEGQAKFKGTGKQAGLKPKDLCLVPQRFSLAAQADGWWVRSVFPWIKRNCQPGSQQDRPTTSHEDWIMLTKSQKYYWDQSAIMVSPATTGNQYKQISMLEDGLPPMVESGRIRRTGDWTFESLQLQIEQARQWADHAEHILKNQGAVCNEDGLPICMPVNPRPYAKAHFATFPSTMIVPLIRAATSAGGCCDACGAPYERLTEKTYPKSRSTNCHAASGVTGQSCQGNYADQRWDDPIETTTTGWMPTCDCKADIVPCRILDPFVGSGTTISAAIGEGRSGIGVDISAEYINEHAAKRTENQQIGLGI